MKNKKLILIISLVVVLAAIVLVLCLKGQVQTQPIEPPAATTETPSEPVAAEPPEPLDEDILMPKVGILD